MKDYRRSVFAAAASLALVACSSDAPDAGPAVEVPTSDGSPEQVIARALALELPTEYSPPPGEGLHHEIAGFAKILCSGVFITGLDPADAAANVGGFISDFDLRGNVVDTVVDFDQQLVALTLPDGVTRTAKRYKNQGCVSHGIGEDSVYFTPTDVERNLPPAATTPWPMGDVLSNDPWPAEVDMDMVEEALEVGFGGADARTLGLVVTYKGRILGERYDSGVDIHTPLESWSMTKSLTGTLVGVLIEQGDYELWQPAPFPEWQQPEDRSTCA